RSKRTTPDEGDLMMASIMARHPGKLLLFASLSTADLCLTGKLLGHESGSFYEGNPIAGAWLHAYGWTGMVIFQVVAVAVAMAAFLFISLSRPRAGGLVLAAACSVLALVVVYSWSLSWLAAGAWREAASERTVVQVR